MLCKVKSFTLQPMARTNHKFPISEEDITTLCKLFGTKDSDS